MTTTNVSTSCNSENIVASGEGLLHACISSSTQKKIMSCYTILKTVCNNVPGTTILLRMNEQAISVTMLNNIVDKLEFLVLVFGDILR